MAALKSCIYELKCKCGETIVLEVPVDPNIGSQERLRAMALTQGWDAGLDPCGSEPTDICPKCIGASD